MSAITSSSFLTTWTKGCKNPLCCSLKLGCIYLFIYIFILLFFFVYFIYLFIYLFYFIFLAGLSKNRPGHFSCEEARTKVADDYVQTCKAPGVSGKRTILRQ